MTFDQVFKDFAAGKKIRNRRDGRVFRRSAYPRGVTCIVDESDIAASVQGHLMFRDDWEVIDELLTLPEAVAAIEAGKHVGCERWSDGSYLFRYGDSVWIQRLKAGGEKGKSEPWTWPDCFHRKWFIWEGYTWDSPK